MIGSALEYTEPLQWIDGLPLLDPSLRRTSRLLTAADARRIARNTGARWYVDGYCFAGRIRSRSSYALNDVAGDSVLARHTTSRLASEAPQAGLVAINSILPETAFARPADGRRVRTGRSQPGCRRDVAAGRARVSPPQPASCAEIPAARDCCRFRTRRSGPPRRSGGQLVELRRRGARARPGRDGSPGATAARPRRVRSRIRLLLEGRRRLGGALAYSGGATEYGLDRGPHGAGRGVLPSTPLLGRLRRFSGPSGVRARRGRHRLLSPALSPCRDRRSQW